jgi:hypothetical protein
MDLRKTLLCLPKEEKNHEQTSLSPSNTKKYNVYFKRYVQTYVKETVSMKELGIVKGVYESCEHINKKIEHVSCSRL